MVRKDDGVIGDRGREGNRRLDWQPSRCPWAVVGPTKRTTYKRPRLRSVVVTHPSFSPTSRESRHPLSSCFSNLYSPETFISCPFTGRRLDQVHFDCLFAPLEPISLLPALLFVCSSVQQQCSSLFLPSSVSSSLFSSLARPPPVPSPCPWWYVQAFPPLSVPPT